jgi:hypothetical protein
MRNGISYGQEDRYRHKDRIVTFATKGETFFKREFLIVWKGALNILRNDHSGDEDRRSWDFFENPFEDVAKARACRVREAFGDERYIGYDLKGKDVAPRMVTDLRDPAAQWTRIPVKEGGFYLSPANGALKGWYLDFEKPEKDTMREPGTGRDITVYVARAKIAKTPGDRSRLAVMPASPRD